MSEQDVITVALPRECDIEIATSTRSNSVSSASVDSLSSQILLHKASEEVELPAMGQEEDNINTDASAGDGIKEYFCGFGKCRPKWMQFFRNSKFFAFILCLNCTIEGALVSGMKLQLASHNFVVIENFY